jgi:sugar-specific transcriptional regulator TrmB
VPRTRVYEVLENLEKAGFCVVRAERVAVYEAVAPEIALAEWSSRREQERRAAAEREKDVRDTLLERLPRPEAGEDMSPGVPFMEALLGSGRVIETFEEEVVTAQERLDIVLSPPVFQPRERWNLLEVEALRRGVQVRVLYTADVATDADRYEQLLRAGGEGRVSSGIPLKLVLRDRIDAMVALPDRRESETGYTVVRITHRDLVAPIQLLFDREWRRGIPLEVPS